MKSYWAALPLCAGAAICAVPAAAQSHSASASISEPVVVDAEQDMSFGNYIPGTKRSHFVLDQNSDVVTQRSGDATHIGGSVMRGKFVVRAQLDKMVRISAPGGAQLLVLEGGTAQMRLDRLRLSVPNLSRMSEDGTLTVYIGGRLRIEANQAPGAYSTQYPITVDYF